MNKSAVTILRWGLAFVFFYAAVASLLSPLNWIGYFPDFLRAVVPARWLLTGFAIYEIILAIFLFTGRKIVWVSPLTAITLVGIAVFNLNILDVTFRDVGLIFMALGLYELVKENKNKDSLPS